MEIPKRRSANVQGYLGTALSIQSNVKPTRKQPDSESSRDDSSSEVRQRQRIVIPSLSRKNPTGFAKIDDCDCDIRIVDESPPSPGSSITSHSSASEEMKVAVNSLTLLDRPTTTVTTTSDGLQMRSSNDRKAYSSERSLSWDDSTLTGTTAKPQLSLSGQHESVSILDFMDHLDDVDESYMLSVFWNSGDLMTSKDAATASESAAGHTKCSYASTSSSMTSTSSYSWTTASRNRHKGAYKNRIVNGAPIASWLDTMDETSNLLFGPLNNWSATRGWKSGETPKWDPKPNRTMWGTPDPLYDKGSYRNETEIQWISPDDDTPQ